MTHFLPAEHKLTKVFTLLSGSQAPLLTRWREGRVIPWVHTASFTARTHWVPTPTCLQSLLLSLPQIICSRSHRHKLVVLCNKSPQTYWLNTTPLIVSEFFKSQVWVGVSWVSTQGPTRLTIRHQAGWGRVRDQDTVPGSFRLSAEFRSTRLYGTRTPLSSWLAAKVGPQLPVWPSAPCHMSFPWLGNVLLLSQWENFCHFGSVLKESLL